MKRSDLTEFAVEEEGFKLSIKRGSDGQPAFDSTRYLPVAAPMAAVPAAAQNLALGASAAPGTSTTEEVGVIYIKSPMVGTFYRAASPESAPFIDVNGKVDDKTVVCIIEAMKIMNEIQAELKGTVLEILVENGQPVEYGQRLFKVKSA